MFPITKIECNQSQVFICHDQKHIYINIYKPTICVYIYILSYTDFVMENIGKSFDSEMGIRKNGRSNLFPITYRKLIYNLWAASMRLVDKLEASPCIN